MNSRIFKSTSGVTAIATVAISLTLTGICFAQTHPSHPGPAHASSGHGNVAAPRTISGRIVAVRRVSRIISVQTPQGEVHQVKVPESAIITSREGSHFNNVRSGQDVHVSGVRDANRGLVARSVSIP
jgi:hypothetical protein